MAHALEHARYVRSNAYEPDWVIANQMGPNALWLLEALVEHLPVADGDRVLDLGCGMAMTSIFLAKEFGARVTAADLWIEATENQQRIDEAGVGELVQAVNAEAHTLPFAKGSFDTIVSLDAYPYFGTADLYLGYLLDFLRPGGRLGIVVPSVVAELDGIPATLAPYWEWDFCCLHSPDWWQRHWEKTGLVTVDHVDTVVDGWQDWLRFNDEVAKTATGMWVEGCRTTHDMLEADRGANLCFTLMTATKP